MPTRRRLRTTCRPTAASARSRSTFQPADGQSLVHKLAEHCDIVVENYMVGQLAKYKLDYASLAKINARLIYCSITGFGQTGPHRMRAGYDFIMQGIGGFMSITGERDDRPGGGPQKAGVAVSDLMTGMYSAVAILAAVTHRERTGQGQYIDMALYDVMVAMLANMNMNYLTSGKAPGRAGNAHQNIVPYQVFAAADGHVVIAVGNDSQFVKFCAVAGAPHLPQTRATAAMPIAFATADVLIAELEAILRHKAGGVLGRRSRRGRRPVRADQRHRARPCRSASRRSRLTDRSWPRARGSCADGCQSDQAVGHATELRATATVARRTHRQCVARLCRRR